MKLSTPKLIEILKTSPVLVDVSGYEPCESDFDDDLPSDSATLSGWAACLLSIELGGDHALYASFHLNASHRVQDGKIIDVSCSVSDEDGFLICASGLTFEDAAFDVDDLTEHADELGIDYSALTYTDTYRGKLEQALADVLQAEYDSESVI